MVTIPIWDDTWCTP